MVELPGWRPPEPSQQPGVKYRGGNSFNPKLCPGWQKPLTSFLTGYPNAPPPKMKEPEDVNIEEKELNKSTNKVAMMITNSVC